MSRYATGGTKPHPNPGYFLYIAGEEVDPMSKSYSQQSNSVMNCSYQHYISTTGVLTTNKRETSLMSISN